ncbi:MAG: tryptophan synthase subunit alpha [Candidatus Omnitrophica bacterium]|nr:tryptophan synthase subunit alpha [Candidatus Omnitrophota bacterium]
MNRIDKKVRALRARRKKAFIAYITAGDPSLLMTGRIAMALEDAGVDILELGIPFSDPIADGPTIQEASGRALKGGVTLHKIFNMVKGLRKKSEMPIVFMTYYNPILRYGLSEFFKKCRDAGVDGVIVPDLPCEEASEVKRYARPNGIDTIFLAAPTSPSGRIRQIALSSRGFIYYVSLTGVTGARRDLAADIAPKIRFIKSITDKPVMVGFGVSNAKQAARVAGLADGVIVGSAIVKIIGAKKNILPAVSRFAGSIARAVHGG